MASIEQSVNVPNNDYVCHLKMSFDVVPTKENNFTYGRKRQQAVRMTNAILQLLCTRRHWGTVESRRPSFIWTTEVCATENHITNSRNSLDLINFDVGLISSEIIVARAWWPNKRQCSNFVDKWYYYTYTIVTFQFPERTVSTSNWSCLSISPFLFFLLVFFFWSFQFSIELQ